MVVLLNYFALFAVNWNKTFVADTAKTEVKIYFMHIVYSYIKKFKTRIGLFEIQRIRIKQQNLNRG